MLPGIILLLSIWYVAGSPTQPKWVREYGQSNEFNQNKIFGFGVSPADKSVALAKKIEIAKKRATADLVKKLSLSIDIKSSLVTRTQKVLDSAHDINIYSEVIEEKSELTLEGVETRIHHSGNRNPVYALAQLDSKKARENHLRKWRILKHKYREIHAQADSLIQSGQEIAAFRMLLESDGIRTDLARHRKVLALLDTIIPRITPQFRRPTTITGLESGILMLLHKIYEEIRLLKGSAHFSISESGVSNRIDDKHSGFLITSLFKRYSKLIPIVPILKTGEEICIQEAIITASVYDATYSVHFEINRNINNTHLLLSLYSVTDKQLIASSEVIVNRERGAASEAPTKSKIDLWTNFGSDSVNLFTGDTLHIFARLRRTGYMRAFHVTKDKQMAVINPHLLNCYIDGHNIGRDILISSVLVTRPYGVEQIVLQYSPKPFERSGNIDISYKDSAFFPVIASSMYDPDNISDNILTGSIFLFVRPGKRLISARKTTDETVP